MVLVKLTPVNIEVLQCEDLAFSCRSAVHIFTTACESNFFNTYFLCVWKCGMLMGTGILSAILIDPSGWWVDSYHNLPHDKVLDAYNWLVGVFSCLQPLYFRPGWESWCQVQHLWVAIQKGDIWLLMLVDHAPLFVLWCAAIITHWGLLITRASKAYRGTGRCTYHAATSLYLGLHHNGHVGLHPLFTMLLSRPLWHFTQQCPHPKIETHL